MASRASRSDCRSWPLVVALLAPALLFAWIVAVGYDGLPWWRGDCPYYAATAVSIAYDGDLDLSNQLLDPSMFTTGQVALDQIGRVVPMHPIWMPLVSIPWFVALGLDGGLVFNLTQVAVLLVLTFSLARRVASPWASAAAGALTACFSMLPHYVWNYSPDVFLTVTVVGGLVLLVPRNRRDGRGAQSSAFLLQSIAAGVLFGVAVTARPTFVLMLVPLGFLIPNRRCLLGLMLGLSLPVGAWMVLNLHLFGSPLVTAYDRMLVMVDGRPEVVSHRRMFGSSIIRGASQQLMDRELGLFWTSPVVLVSLLGLGRLWRRSRALALYFLGSSVPLYLVFSTYEAWTASHAGNRFLMPVAVLGVLPLACLLEERVNLDVVHKGRVE